MSTPKDTAIKAIAEGIFSIPSRSQDPPRLIGAFCKICNRKFFPRPKYCPSCLGEVEGIFLAAQGTIYSFTCVRTKPPFGLPRPYCIGYIDLTESRLRIFSLLDPAAINQLRVGLKVKLAVGLLGNDGQGEPCLRPYFTPDTED